MTEMSMMIIMITTMLVFMVARILAGAPAGCCWRGAAS
jgi:hypothetical protein